KPVKVKFADLNIKGKVILGHVVRNPLNPAKSTTVNLNRKFLQEIKSDNSGQAMRTLLHEVSHVYDFQRKMVGHEAELLASCSANGHQESSQCRKIKRKKYTISDSPLFLSVAGWKKKKLRGHKQVNTMLGRRV